MHSDDAISDKVPFQHLTRTSVTATLLNASDRLRARQSRMRIQNQVAREVVSDVDICKIWYRWISRPPSLRPPRPLTCSCSKEASRMQPTWVLRSVRTRKQEASIEPSLLKDRTSDVSRTTAYRVSPCRHIGASSCRVSTKTVTRNFLRAQHGKGPSYCRTHHYG